MNKSLLFFKISLHLELVLGRFGLAFGDATYLGIAEYASAVNQFIEHKNDFNRFIFQVSFLVISFFV